MDDIIKQMIAELPVSPTELSEGNIKKIRSYLPVPTDYKILWADILNFGGYPAGIVLTDRAIVLKSTKEEVKKKNQEIKAKNQELKKEERLNRIHGIYQIIPWEYYSPDEYEIVVETLKDKKQKFYFKSGGNELAQFSSVDLYNFFKKYNSQILAEQTKANEIIEASTFSAINSLNVEGTMFNAAYGSDQTRTGHGIYAEEAGVILDVLSGEKATVVGRDNAKNGPDKIVNTAPIQCKYCKTAYTSVNSCFKKDANGVNMFRYYDLSGNPMKVEVPSDQYLQAIEYMKTRISNGQVAGVNDPNVAYDIVRKGKLSYHQACNLAKAGTIESLTFDAATGAVNCLSVLGISSIVTFAQIFWATKDYKKAAKGALLTGLQVYGLSFLGGVISSQISRTGLTNVFKPLATSLSQHLSQKFVTGVVNAFRALAGKKAIYGIAAQKSFAKALSSNMISEGIMFLVFSIPDTYQVFNKKMSSAQYIKNMTSLAASFLASIGGTAITGAKIGEKITVKKANVIGLVAGGACGLVAGVGIKTVGNLLHEDDAVITTRMFNAVMTNMIIDHMLSDKEVDLLIEELDDKKKELANLQKALLSSNSQASDITAFLLPIINGLTEKREKVDEKCNGKFMDSIADLLMNGDLAYGV